MYSRTRYHLFIDESGNHDLAKVDSNWPVFVLVGLLVGEAYYAKTLVPRLKSVKRKYEIPPETTLHSRHIRKWTGDFQFLRDESVRASFYEELNRIFEESRIRLYAVVIQKQRLVHRFLNPPDPYELSLGQLLSVVCGPPGTPGPWRPVLARITAESRGRREDKALQAHYRTFRWAGLNSYGADHVPSRRPSTVGRLFPEQIQFVTKKHVVGGLELADLAAYPIGRAFVNRQWVNPAYRAVASKLRALVEFP